MMLALAVSACGPAAPEVYNLVFEPITIPDSCFTTVPTTKTTVSQPALVRATVWDGPSEAFLEIAGGGSQDMGDAPSVPVSGVLRGKHGSSGWAFVGETVTTATSSATTSTTSTKISLTFERGLSGKGTGSASSSLGCSGTGCPSTLPKCDINNIAFQATRIQVTYETAP